MQSIGQIIRKARGETPRVALAKRLKITPAYLGHLERDSHVHLSERLIKGLARTLEVSPRRLTQLAINHNAKSRRWYRAYRARTQ